LIFVQRRRLFAVGIIETDVKAQSSSNQASLGLFRSKWENWENKARIIEGCRGACHRAVTDGYMRSNNIYIVFGYLLRSWMASNSTRG